MNKLYDWTYAVYLIIFVLLVMTYGLFNNGGPWWIPFVILFLFFGFYCEHLKAIEERDKIDGLVAKLKDNNGICEHGNDTHSNCSDCDEVQYKDAEEMIELTQIMSEAFNCDKPGIT